MWIEYNPNPTGARKGDCAVRAVAKATGKTWEASYVAMALEGFVQGDMPSANAVWGTVLRREGFERRGLPDTCPDCYSLAAFAAEHPMGVFVVALPGHVATVIDGDYYDVWDSGGETPLYYFYREER